MMFVRDWETGRVKDPEQNAVLSPVRGYSSGHKDWQLNWNGDVFGFTAKDTTHYGGKTENIPIGIEWFIASINIPETLQSKRPEIIKMIKEAMEAEGLGVSFDGYPSKVIFDPRLIR
jgi:hypothetical protein